jgi:eukaryotic-like serine/threonine-protein kinase
MTLSAGTKLGPYEILSPLGAGGMGEVYRAKDTRLERTVAVKVLPSHMSSSPEVRQRFEREAKTISQLSHPHICALYDVGREGETEYLVMEYLEGETLSERLTKGPLPLEQTLRYGQQIADALDKAHRQGIVHRDLKPGNVMLTKSGVKLLDFGLAKAMAPVAPLSSLTALPTQQGLTQEGTILGTLQYMAPEQLEGKEADGRTDIFAFGAVLYEMATGRKAFSGAAQASLIGAILHTEPQPISAVQPMSPPALDRVVKTCLAKDPEERWQSAADVRRELQWIAEGSAAGVAAPAVVASKRRVRERLAWTGFALAAAAALIVGSLHLRRRPESDRVFRSSILPPEKTRFAFQGSPPAVSPDGRRIAFSAGLPNARGRLWVRPFEASEAQPLPETEGGSGPFWSPDSRFVGFFADGKLKKIDVTGGTPQTLCDAPSGRAGAWSREGVILFTTDGPLHRVPESGGASSPVTRVDEGVLSHNWPTLLPDGRHFLYLRYLGRSGDASNPFGLYLGSLDSKDERELLRVRANVAYAPAPDGSSAGHLLYLQARVLVARPFDARRLEFTGEAFPIAEQVQLFGAGGTAVFSVSATGLLAYQRGAGEASELVWFDRSGKRLESLGEPANYSHPRISHDGRRVAVVVGDAKSADTDLWLFDVPRRAMTRFTFGPAVNIFPVWSPDDTRIVFASNRRMMHELYQRATSGSGGDELLLESKTSFMWPTDWSPDGLIAFQSRDAKARTAVDVGFVSVSDRKAVTLLGTSFDERNPQFSPDGRWLAYGSDESGRFEIYVQSFPGMGQKWQVSSGGGATPRWRRDGKEIFFLKFPEKTLMTAEVKSGPTFEVVEPRALFQTQVKWSDFGTQYDVSPNGSRFLINTLVGEERSEAITIVQNWQAGSKK